MNIDNEPVSVWRKNLKQRALALFNNKCSLCGYDRCTAALEFHHLDPNKKDFSISDAYANPKKWSIIVDELKKCILVCANCHREIHQGLVSVEGINSVKSDTDYRITEHTHHKCTCGVVIKLTQKYCSKQCSDKNRTKSDWYSRKEELLDLRDVKNLSYKDIGLKYSVSDNTVRKWYNRFKHSD